MSFLSSLLNIVTQFTLNITNGFITIPLTQLRRGSIFTNMLSAINYVDQSGQYQLGQSFGSTSALSQPSFQAAPAYQPGGTTPPKTFPTFQPSGYQVPLDLNPSSMYQTSAEAIRVLKMFEGLHQRAYVINGQAYIGYGHQLSSFDTNAYVSRDQADQMLAADLSAAEGVVKGAVSGKLTQGQFDALVDFAFTVSAANFKGSTVVSKFNSGDIAGACTDLMQWSYVNLNGTISQDLHLAARRAHNVQWASMPIDPLPPPGSQS